ncbi:MAG: hypothetical protein Q4D32_02095 [Eubacteriales bacterium]|nr:hypothetical protein [Eubacteriales bacterium]
MEFKKLSKKALSLAIAVAVAATTIVVPATSQKAEAAKKYSAYLCFASKGYNGVLVNHNESDRSKGVMNGNKKTSLKGVKVKNATFKKGKFTFTVSVTGKNLKKFKADKGWNSLYVDTSLPGSSKAKLKVTKAVVKFDGKTVKTIKNPALTPDPGKTQDYTQIMCLNTWNKYANAKWSASSVTKMPKKSISVTITGKLK